MADVYLVPKDLPDPPSPAKTLLVSRYKHTRLTALQLDPGAFGSTYAREVRFTSQTWMSRLLNPLSKTFVSVDTAVASIVSRPIDPVELAYPQWFGTASIFGPKPLVNSSLWTTYTPDNFNDPPDLSAVKDSNAIYMITGVFVHPDHRRQGRAKRLIQAAVNSAAEEAKTAGASKVTVLLEIESEDQAVDRLYESVGFSAVERHGASRRGMMWEVDLTVS